MLEVRGLTAEVSGEAAAEGRERDWDEVVTR